MGKGGSPPLRHRTSLSFSLLSPAPFQVGDLVERGLESLALAAQCGVRMAFGSDLLGELHQHQLREFELRGRVLEPQARWALGHSLRVGVCSLVSAAG